MSIHEQVSSLPQSVPKAGDGLDEAGCWGPLLLGAPLRASDIIMV